MYTHYMELNEKYEMAFELDSADHVEVLGEKLHYRLRWCRMFRERFPEPVELMEARAAARRVHKRLENALEVHRAKQAAINLEAIQVQHGPSLGP